MTPEQIAMWTDKGIEWALLGGQALLVLVIGWIVSNMFYSRTVAMIQARGLDLALGRFLAQMVRWSILGATIIAALGIVGVEVMGLMAVFASAGVAVGLALQGNLSNFASGVMILLYRPFDVGDFINAAGEAGSVSAMSLVSTTITTPDNQLLILPNSSIWGGVIRNVTAQDTRRVDMTVGVSYDADLDQTGDVLMEVVTAHEKVMKDPAPVIKVVNLGDNSVDFVVRPWCKTSDYWDVFFDLNKQIKQRLDKEGIGIPYPQRDLHLVSVGEGVKLGS